MDNTSLTEPTEHDARLLAHLREEEQTLAILLVAVREIRQSLITRDGERLTQALQTEADGFEMSIKLKPQHIQPSLICDISISIVLHSMT